MAVASGVACAAGAPTARSKATNTAGGAKFGLMRPASFVISTSPLPRGNTIRRGTPSAVQRRGDGSRRRNIASCTRPSAVAAATAPARSVAACAMAARALAVMWLPTRASSATVQSTINSTKPRSP
jgi:hypothetical protein